MENFHIFLENVPTIANFSLLDHAYVFKVYIDSLSYIVPFEYLSILLSSRILGFWWVSKSTIDFDDSEKGRKSFGHSFLYFMVM